MKEIIGFSFTRVQMLLHFKSWSYSSHDGHRIVDYMWTANRRQSLCLYQCVRSKGIKHNVDSCREDAPPPLLLQACVVNERLIDSDRGRKAALNSREGLGVSETAAGERAAEQDGAVFWSVWTQWLRVGGEVRYKERPESTQSYPDGYHNPLKLIQRHTRQFHLNPHFLKFENTVDITIS